MRSSAIFLIFLSLGTSAFACTDGRILQSKKEYEVAKEKFLIGEGTKGEVANARNLLLANQVCKQIRAGANCTALQEKAEMNLAQTQESFRVGVATRGDVKDASARLTATMDMCF